MVFLTGADSRLTNTMKNTIDDVDYIINESYFIFILQ